MRLQWPLSSAGPDSTAAVWSRVSDAGICLPPVRITASYRDQQGSLFNLQRVFLDRLAIALRLKSGWAASRAESIRALGDGLSFVRWQD